MIVLKFGGTSVGDAEAIERTAGIVATRVNRGPIVVVSALAGVTNDLIGLAEQAVKGHLIGALRAIEGLRDALGEAAVPDNGHGLCWGAVVPPVAGGPSPVTV